MYIILALINLNLINLLYITLLFMLQYAVKECIRRKKNCIKHIFSQATPLWPDGLPISQRAQVRVGAPRRIGHSLFRVAIRSKHHPRHAKHSGAILTNRLHKALVAPSLVLHIHPSFRFLRIAIHRKDARDAKKSASQSVQYFQMDI